MPSIVINSRITRYDDSHRLRIWVAETSNNIPAELFVFQRVPFVPFDGCPDVVFSHIASYTDIVDFRTEPTSDCPFYRASSLDLVFPNLAMLYEKWRRMQGYLRHTVEDITRLNVMDPAEVLFIEVT